MQGLQQKKWLVQCDLQVAFMEAQCRTRCGLYGACVVQPVSGQSNARCLGMVAEGAGTKRPAIGWFSSINTGAAWPKSGCNSSREVSWTWLESGRGRMRCLGVATERAGMAHPASGWRSSKEADAEQPARGWCNVGYLGAACKWPAWRELQGCEGQHTRQV